MIALRVLRTALVLLVVCAILVSALRALGRQAPLPPTYLEPGAGCRQPCWQGIRPGFSTREQFARRSRDASPYAGRVMDYGSGIAAMFELSTYGAITLADVVRVLGTPERVGCLGLTHTTLYPGQSPVIGVDVYFARGLIQVNAVRPDRWPRITPDMQVRTVRYFAPGEPTYPIGDTTEWRGFASLWQYPACAY